MKTNKSKIKLYTLLVILTFLMHYYGTFERLYALSATDQKSIIREERDYLNYKAQGKYERAIEIIEEWTLNLSDPVLIETNLFRLMELIEYQELIERGIQSLIRIRNGNEIVGSDRFLTARINFFLNRLFLRDGRIKDANSIRDSLGFVSDYRIIGPFDNRGSSDFEIEHPPERSFSESEIYLGKINIVKWFDTKTDLTGMIDFEDLFTKVDDSLFYLYRIIDIHESGEYILSFGKTGYMDIWIDGGRIVENRKRHGFDFDQYHLKVLLQKGEHSILIKLGDSTYDGVKWSLRITYLRAVGDAAESGDLLQQGEADSLLRPSYFSSLESLLNYDHPNEYSSFLIGYLYYISGLASEEDKESQKYFNRVENDRGLASVSCYYQGLMVDDENKKDAFFYKSLNNRNRIESLNEIALIKLDNNFIFEAFQIIDMIKNIDPLSNNYLILKANAFISLGWYHEALKIASILKKSKYPSNAYLIEAMIYKAQKKEREAAQCHKILYEGDRYDRDYIDDLIECYDKLGMYDSIEKILNRSSRFFPNNVWIRLKLSEIAEKMHCAKASLPLISSAMKLSPYNKEVLLQMGIAYHKIGKEELARYYLNLALKYNPNNFLLKRYLRIINDEQMEIERYLISESPSSIAIKAAKYNNEPAITLLRETAIRILSDGSYEKWIHRIYLVNDPSLAKEFSREYIVIDPSTDRIEDLRCFVINNGDIIETSISHKRSLSDPEARLYYDLEANIISLPSIRKGSIIDLRYVIKSKGGDIYKNYYGERIIAGNKYRTIYSNIVISFPEKKGINYHLKGISEDSVEHIKDKKKKIIRIDLHNLPPYKEEIAMPHTSEILPSVCFTSHKSWGDLYRWYVSLVRGKIRVSGEMKSVISKITDEDDDKLDLVRKIFNHVNREIRYVGFEFGIGGIQPRSADLTYHTKMGDCKDITIVLMAMLREVGVDVKLALLRTSDNGDADISVPYLGEFNHAICYVDIGEGLFVDGTAKMSGFKELPANDRGRTALLLDEKDYSFVKINDRFLDENIEAVTTEIKIHKNGEAKLERTIRKQGSFASRVRYDMLDMEKRILGLNEYWNRIFTGSRVKDFKDFEINLDKPVSYSYRVDIPSFFNKSNEEIVFKAFLVPSNYYRNYCMLKDRRFPLELPGKWTSEISITYHIPDGFDVHSIPNNDEFNSDKYDASFRYILSDKKIEVYSILHFKHYRIDVEEYDLFREFTRFIEKKENERIILIR
ncbi:MAG: DUF3857 domain-containing protein [Spirochaetota bacterium]|nr:DUF3857 domain-containing protein [Spirochaetota bacterium]